MKDGGEKNTSASDKGAWEWDADLQYLCAACDSQIWKLDLVVGSLFKERLFAVYNTTVILKRI